MIHVKKEGVILNKTLAAFENEGVLNPATIKEGETVHLFYRAVRKGNYSSIGYCRMDKPLEISERNVEPLIIPESNYESKGVEDPRIVKIEDLYYLTYTAYDGVNASGALAVSKDLKHFDKLGIIVPRISFEEFCLLANAKGAINEKYIRFNSHLLVRGKQRNDLFVWDKNVIFFPRKLNGKLCFLHRIRPDIQFVAINNLQELTHAFWHDYFLHFDEHIVLCPKHKHEVSYIGGGCPPIETANGWLLIYHGVHDTVNGYIYSACAALLDLENPRTEIARLPYPLFEPEKAWELTGEVNNVCFPTGTVVFGDTLYIYYGAADEQIACATVSLSELISELMIYKK